MPTFFSTECRVSVRHAYFLQAQFHLFYFAQPP